MVDNKVYEYFKYLLIKYENAKLNLVEDINMGLDSILLELNVYPDAPKFIVTRALYTDVNDECLSGKFVIRPSVNYALQNVDMRKSFNLINDNMFFCNFIKNILDWINYYNSCVNLELNLNKLNSRMLTIIENMSFPYNIEFTFGAELIDIGDNYIKLGLSMDVISNIINSDLFSSDNDIKNRYELIIINTLKECIRPYDILKTKSEFTYDFNIYNRKSVHKLIRKFVNRNIAFVRVGLGYIETENLFGLVEKKAVSSKNIDNIIGEYIIEDNKHPTIIERKNELDKIIIRYKLMPFDKKTTVLSEISLKEFLKLSEREWGIE